jgi:NADP-dependent 3-hydroxy acid dehydrogenase YdfG
MKRRLDQMVVVITGASAGIGRGLAEQLSAAGARLVLAARRLPRLEALNDALGGHHLCVQTDVSQPMHCQHLIDAAVRRFGRIDTLVCNAGFGVIGAAHQVDSDSMHELFATNVLGTSECIRHAVPAMLAQPHRDGYRGHVVIVSSAAARRGLPLFGAYTAMKAAQLSIAEALRVELLRGFRLWQRHPILAMAQFSAIPVFPSTHLPRPSKPHSDIFPKDLFLDIRQKFRW